MVAGLLTPVWVTKYALTKGVFCIDVEGGRGDMVHTPGAWPQSYCLGKDAFESEHEAKQHAERKRREKIESLNKQLDKLRRMAF